MQPGVLVRDKLGRCCILSEVDIHLIVLDANSSTKPAAIRTTQDIEIHLIAEAQTVIVFILAFQLFSGPSCLLCHRFKIVVLTVVLITISDQEGGLR